MVARLAMFLCLIAAMGYAANAVWQTHKADEDRQQSEAASVRATGLVDSAPKRLAPEFIDEHGTLLADPPKDPSKLADPPALVLGHLVDSDTESPDISWTDFDRHLSVAMGRSVTDVVVENGPSQMDKIKAGQINIMALHAADAPFLVSHCGYHPFAVLGDESGASGNRLDLIVPTHSALAHPEDLRGHTLTCTGPLSIVGYRAAIVLLLQNQKLSPNVDYFVSWSQGQKESIAAVVKGTCEAAAVSDDKLQSALANGSVKVDTASGVGATSEKVPVDQSKYKVIYQSDVFPRTTIGYFYNLKPETATMLREAILSYKPAPTDDTDKPTHFIPVDYKADFALIRDIDDRFDPRMESKAKRDTAATAP